MEFCGVTASEVSLEDGWNERGDREAEGKQEDEGERGEMGEEVSSLEMVFIQASSVYNRRITYHGC